MSPRRLASLGTGLGPKFSAGFENIFTCQLESNEEFAPENDENRAAGHVAKSPAAKLSTTSTRRLRNYSSNGGIMNLRRILYWLVASSSVLPTYADGVNPLSISSPSPGNFSLTWFGATNRPYQLESTADLIASPWTDFGSLIIGAGSQISVPDSPSQASQKFYRLRIGAIRQGFNAYQLEGNDDGSTATTIPIGFSILLFGQTYTECWINNNGNITFDNPLSIYTPGPLQSVGFTIIAPFWADVDTRLAGSDNSDVVRYSYGTDTVNGRSAFGVNYVNVGYYRVHVDKLNSFQLVLIDRSDTGSGNFDIEFNYNQVLWETGDASGGQAGYGGSPCRVGITNGSDRTIELTHSGETLQFLDTILSSGQPNYATGLIYQTRNSTIPGRLVFQVRGGNVLGALQVDAGPDQDVAADQSTTTLAGSAQDPGGGGVTVNWTLLDGPDTVSFSDPNSLTPTVTLPATTGTYVLQLTATSSNDSQISAADTMRINHF